MEIYVQILIFIIQYFTYIIINHYLINQPISL